MAEPAPANNSTTTSTSTTSIVWWTASTSESTTTTSNDTVQASKSPETNSALATTVQITSTASGGAFTSTTPTGINGTADSTGSQTSNSNGQFNSGTLAGAIVGSLLGGFILAFLAAFLFFRRRKRQTGDNGAWAPEKSAPAKSVDGVSSYVAAPLPAKSLPPTALAGAAAGFDLASYIPQPAEDSAVCMRVQVLLDQVGLHIDNYYSRTTSNPPLTSDTVSRIGGYDSSNLPASVATMLANPKAQRPVLIHVLAHSALQAIQPGSQGLSLLPVCYRLAPQRQRVGSVDTSTCCNNKNTMPSI